MNETASRLAALAILALTACGARRIRAAAARLASLARNWSKRWMSLSPTDRRSDVTEDSRS